MPGRVRVLCVDDNTFVAEAIRRVLEDRSDLQWVGWLPDAREVLAEVRRVQPNVILLDVDMPHRDAFEALAELTECAPEVRVLMLSGHTRRDLVERAIEAGAMGYLSKNEGTAVILDGILRAHRGDLALGAEAEAAFHGR